MANYLKTMAKIFLKSIKTQPFVSNGFENKKKLERDRCAKFDSS